MPVLLVQTGMEQSGAADVFSAGRGGSGEFAGSRALSIKEQIDSQIEKLGSFHAKQYIAYYQAFTNTYADLDYLRRVYEPSFLHEKVAVVDIATRPDCVGEDVVSLLCEYSKRKPVWVELGLQTIHEDTAAYIRRGYDLTCFENALKRLNDAQIPVIVHVILGLPGEDKEKMLETIRYLNNAGIFGIKLHFFMCLKILTLQMNFVPESFRHCLWKHMWILLFPVSVHFHQILSFTG